MLSVAYASLHDPSVVQAHFVFGGGLRGDVTGRNVTGYRVGEP